MPNKPLIHHLAVEDRILAVLRECNASLTPTEIARFIGTVRCACNQTPALEANHRGRPNGLGSCGGVGWRPAMDIDVKPRLDRLFRRSIIDKAAIAGGVAFYLATEVESVDGLDDPWAGESPDALMNRILNDRS